MKDLNSDITNESLKLSATMTKITFYYVAYTCVTVDVPKELDQDPDNWTEEQWDEMYNKADEKVSRYDNEWERSTTDEPEIDP